MNIELRMTIGEVDEYISPSADGECRSIAEARSVGLVKSLNRVFEIRDPVFRIGELSSLKRLD